MTNKLYFITYGDKKYRKSKKRLVLQAKLFNFESIKTFGFNDLSNDFIAKTKPYIGDVRGGGYWLWKPFFLKKTFDEMQDGDILLYLDAGCELNISGKKRFLEYIEIMNANKGVLSFHLPCLREYSYTNDAVFEYFEIDSSSAIYNSYQIVGGVLLLKKNDLTKKLIDDFFNVAIQRPDLFSDLYNVKTTRSNFIDHRHDQSIFSVLRKKYGLITIEDETYNEDFNLMLEFPFLAKRIRDQSSFFLLFLYKLKHKFLN
jgi:hypothetical protein